MVIDASCLASGGMMVKVTVVVDGGKTKVWFGRVSNGFGVGMSDGKMWVQ